MQICMRIPLICINSHMRIIVNHHDLYMVGKKRFSALKWHLVCEDWLRIEATGANLMFCLSLCILKFTGICVMMSWCHDVILQNDIRPSNGGRQLLYFLQVFNFSWNSSDYMNFIQKHEFQHWHIFFVLGLIINLFWLVPYVAVWYFHI